MSATGTLAAQVERQACEITERAAAASRTGVFSATHLGAKALPALVDFALSSPEAERAYMRFLRASLNFERRRDPAAQVRLAARALQLDELILKAPVKGDRVTLLRKELSHYLRTVQQVDEQAIAAAEQLVAALNKAAGLRQVVAGMNIARETALARLRVAFLDQIAALSHRAAVFKGADETFFRAYRKLATTLGADLDSGWKQAFEYMADNADAIRAYRAEIERLEAAIAKETDLDKLAQLRDKALPATRKSGVHSKLKGLLGELYVRRWRDWRLIKSSYLEVANRAARRLGKAWEAVPVTGGIFLGGAESWDEAILLVNRSRVPPEAKLFMAAQFKVAVEPRALQQTLNDIVREDASRSLRIVLADKTEEMFLLTPLPPDQVAHRWVANAAGGSVPLDDIAKLYEKQVQVQLQTMPISVDEFNVITDRLLKTFGGLLK